VNVQGPDGKIISFPDGTPPEVMKAAMRRHYGGVSTVPSHGPQGSPSRDAIGGVFSAMNAVNPMVPTPGIGPMLPYIGGMAGGALGTLAGGPALGIGGAGIGGMAGKAAERALGGQSPSLTAMGGSAAQMVAGEVGGQVLGGVANRVAPVLMKKALGSMTALARRFNTTPEAIAAKVLSKRLPPGLEGERLAQQAADVPRVKRSAILMQSSRMVSSERLSLEVIRDAENSIGRRLTAGERSDLISQVEAEADRILTARTHGAVRHPTPGRYNPREAEQIKEVAARNAQPAYNAQQAGRSLSASPAFSEQLAGGARTALNRIPGVEPLSAEIRDAMMSKQAIAQAMRRPGEWTPLHVGPVAAGFKLARKPMHNIALKITSPAFQAFLRRSPTAAMAEIQRMLQEDGSQ
jgi:hypothetical protein